MIKGVLFGRFTYVMAFKIMRHNSRLETLKTIGSSSSSQPSHSSSSNHTARVSVTQWWGPALWFLLLLWQQPAVWTWASYLCPELQKGSRHLTLFERLALLCLPHVLSALDCRSPLMHTCSSAGNEVWISVGLRGRAAPALLKCAVLEESVKSPSSGSVPENLPTAGAHGLVPKYLWVNLSRCK